MQTFTSSGDSQMQHCLVITYMLFEQACNGKLPGLPKHTACVCLLESRTQRKRSQVFCKPRIWDGYFIYHVSFEQACSWKWLVQLDTTGCGCSLECRAHWKHIWVLVKLKYKMDTSCTMFVWGRLQLGIIGYTQNHLLWLLLGIQDSMKNMYTFPMNLEGKTDLAKQNKNEALKGFTCGSE